ncbi:MAG: rod shape-determining protein MreD [Spirochaetes bacterium]|nr:rod shape-determining protein MreD [Spirochaetota bacterium]
MTPRVLLYSGMLVALAALQTNVLVAVEIAGVRPDLALIVIAYYSVTNGSFEGEIGAFVGGLVEDLLSLSPLGFHALLRTVMGFLFGVLHNRMLVDAVLVPVLLLTVGTLVKALFAGLTAAVFGVDGLSSAVLSSRLPIEVGYNAVLAPILFALLRFIRPLRQSRRETTTL